MLSAAIFIPMVAAAVFALIRVRQPVTSGRVKPPGDDPERRRDSVSGGSVAMSPEVEPQATHPMPSSRLFERRLQTAATAIAAVPLGLLAVTWLRFEGTGAFELVEAVEWIPTLGVGYRVGVDGLSLPLAAMTALVFVASIAYPVEPARAARTLLRPDAVP